MQIKLSIKTVLSAALLGFGAAAVADDAPVKMPPPDVVIRDATVKVRKLIRDNHDEYVANQGQFFAMVDREIVPLFDMQFISQLVLARNYRGATPEQRKRFADAFKTMIVRSYANALLEYYDAAEAEWQPLRMAPEASDVTVRARLIRKDGPPLPIDFDVHRVGDAWKIYDVKVENISLVTNFRAQFAQEIRANGLDALIHKLEDTQARSVETFKKDEADDGNSQP